MKYSLKHKLFSSLLLLAVSLTPLTIAAPAASALAPLPVRTFAITCPAGQGQQAGSGTCCPTSATTAQACLFAKYINPVIAMLSVVVGLVAVIGIIIGAIQFSSSAGDPQKAANGKNHIRNALVGLLAYLLLFALLQFLVPGGKFN